MVEADFYLFAMALIAVAAFVAWRLAGARARQTVRCSNRQCRTVNRPEAEFCSRCGAPLHAGSRQPN